MTNTIKNFIETLKYFANDISYDNYTIIIREGGEIVAYIRVEEDMWGEGDGWDETRLTAEYISPSISDDVLEFLDLCERPVVRGLKEAWKQGIRETFMQKGWHVK
jgi:hypothetical protein